VPAGATVHFEGVNLARVYLADGVTQVQAGTDLTADQFAGLLLNPFGTSNSLAGYFAYSVTDGTSLTEHRIPISLFSGFNGATLTGTALNEAIVGGNYGDVLNGGAGHDQLTGGGGADRFVFDHDALTDAQAAQPKLDQILDYSNAQGDTIDISQLLATAFGPGEQASDRVQVKADASGAFATLQVDPDGAANGTHFTTIAQINGAHVGDIIAVMLDHAQQAAQLHVS
jgi:Ca2+-binding RTX toxin-like protein